MDDLEEIFKYGKKEDIDRILDKGLPRLNDVNFYLSFSVYSGNTEVVDHLINKLKLGKETFDSLIYHCVDKEMYDYFLNLGAHKNMITTLSVVKDIDFIKYLYELGFTFSEGHLESLLSNSNSIEMIEKGVNFGVLDSIFIKYWNSNEIKSLIYLMKKGYIKEKSLSELVTNYVCARRFSYDFDFLDDIGVELEEKDKEFMVRWRNTLVIYFIGLNEGRFKNYPGLVEKGKNLVKIIHIMKILKK